MRFFAKLTKPSERKPVWVNPDPVMIVTRDGEVTKVTLASGFTVTCVEDAETVIARLERALFWRMCQGGVPDELAPTGKQ